MCEQDFIDHKKWDEPNDSAIYTMLQQNTLNGRPDVML